MPLALELRKAALEAVAERAREPAPGISGRLIGAGRLSVAGLSRT
jgi:hypothetical protein